MQQERLEQQPTYWVHFHRKKSFLDEIMTASDSLRMGLTVRPLQREGVRGLQKCSRIDP